VTVTPSHPLFVQQNGQFTPVCAKDLSAGDYIGVPQTIPSNGSYRLEARYRASQSYNAVKLSLPDQWTPELARLLGYIVAEGYVDQRDNNTGFVSITNNDQEVLADAGKTLSTLGLNYTIREPHDGKDAKELMCSSGEFVSFLAQCDSHLLTGSGTQRVPPAILRTSTEIKAAFLKAYIEGEGHVSVTQREISIASMSRDLLATVRSLLLSLGITSQLAERQNGSYRLRISGDQFERYVDEVGFITERKTQATLKHADKGSNTNLDVVPNIGTELKRIREALGLVQASCNLPRSTYQHYERGRRNPSHDALSRVVSAFEAAITETTAEQTAIASDGGVDTLAQDVAALRQLADGDVGWEKIETIEPVNPEDEWVYDLEIEGTHNYLTNNVISHNSQMLSYIENIAPRSVYTSGKGSSSAGLTAAAVRDDFGDGQQWTLEAGALVLADQGIAAVDELDKMRCVTGDTLVHCGDGQIERIGSLATEAARTGDIESLPNGRTIRDTEFDVWTMTEDGSLVQRPVTAVHEYEAPDALTEVTLESGERLTATDDHPFFVRQDDDRIERAASDLETGDWVYVPRSIPSPASDGGVASEPAAATQSVPAATPTTTEDVPSPELGAVLGYLSGDGNVYYNRSEGSYGVRFTNSEEELLADFERVCETAFDASTTRPASEQRDDGVETVRLHGKKYVNSVLDAGMNLENYDGKSFPTAVSAGSRRTKAAFIRALADSEGTVDTSTGNVRISSASYELLIGTKQLLLEFGVSAQIQTRERSAKRDLYVLAITDSESLAAYARHIGFTLDRKQDGLDTVVESASGDRTILDVIPSAGVPLKTTRDSLRLYQRECGINSATYCNFETETANISIHRARRVLDAFEARKRAAKRDAKRLDQDTESAASWELLAEIRDRYHIPYTELAEGTEYSHQQLASKWGTTESLRDVARKRLETIVTGVASTDISEFRELVAGDVKWRRVDSVDSVPTEAVDDTVPVLREELADLLGSGSEKVTEEAHDLLNSEPSTDSWDSLRQELDRYDLSFAGIADELGVAPSTVSRWFSGAVETDRFPEARSVASDQIESVRTEISRLLDAIDAAETPKVYDLTVDGTHNFLANGMVVHNSEDRSAMHQALEQQEISISKAGINATLKSRCSLLGAANPKYGRFDQYEPIGEQIDLEPALVSRFDLIFTVTDQPDPEHDGMLADHILKTNYAGELNTQRANVPTSEFTQQQVDDVTEQVAPDIDAELLRKYIAHAKRSCFPTMTDEAKAAIREFYVDLRSKGADEDAPIPVTARKLEALVRLAEASARVRLSDTVDEEDATRSVDIVRSCLKDIGVDPETGQFDADVVETGTSKTQRDRIKNIKQLIGEIEEEFEEGAPMDEVLDRANEIGMDASKAEQEIEKLRRKGDVYEPKQGHLRTT
jgi:replicative DNA helicase Mcm